MSFPIKTVRIGGEERPVHFGMNAMRQIQPVLQAKLKSKMNGHGESSAVKAAIEVFTDLDFQIFLIKTGLQEGERIAMKSTTSPPAIPDLLICDWLDENPEAIEQTIEIYNEQTIAAQARKNGMPVEEFKAKVMEITQSLTSTGSNPSPSAGSE